jgi:hypothetical protein
MYIVALHKLETDIKAHIGYFPVIGLSRAVNSDIEDTRFADDRSRHIGL